MRLGGKRRRKNIYYPFIVVTAVIMLFFGVSQALAFWSQPNAPAPDSSVGYPLIQGNDSDFSAQLIQIKSGKLTIGPPGTLDVSGGLNTTTINSTSTVSIESGQLCLNGICISSWGAIAGGYVHLSPTADDVGTIWLQSNSAEPEYNSKVIPNTSTYGVRVTADEPGPLETKGIVGYSSNDASPPGNTPTYGVGGTAANVSFCSGGVDDGDLCIANSDCDSNLCVPYDKSIGVWGSNGGNTNAWAGQFNGRVGVEGDFCINGDCRNVHNWGPPGGFNDYVRVQETGDPVFQSGLVKLEGTVKSGQFVLGEPLASTSILLTCGDNLCNYGENGENPVNCPADCS